MGQARERRTLRDGPGEFNPGCTTHEIRTPGVLSASIWGRRCAIGRGERRSFSTGRLRDKSLGIHSDASIVPERLLLPPDPRLAMKKLLLLLTLLLAPLALASSSAPATPSPSGGNSSGNSSGSSRPSRSDGPELSFYNDGTLLLFQKQWAGAAKQFAAAVAINPKLAEAHNNYAYVLRKQGPENYAKSLEHYNKAIELKPKMAEAYMYRGALYSLMGKADLASADYDTLVKFKSKLAPHLKKIMETGQEEEPEQFYGVSKKK